MAEQGITTLSAKGQVVLPKAAREEMGWTPGAKLRVQRTADGILLTAAPAFLETTPAQVFGSLRYPGPAKSVDEMDAAVLEEARSRG